MSTRTRIAVYAIFFAGCTGGSGTPGDVGDGYENVRGTRENPVGEADAPSVNGVDKSDAGKAQDDNESNKGNGNQGKPTPVQFDAGSPIFDAG